MRPAPKSPTASWRTAKGSASERGYDHKWTVARARFLSANPLCVMCQADGRIEAARVVDHITPHKGDQTLFWDTANWQALCKTHHDSDKQMFEKSGEVRNKFTEDGRVVW